MESTPAHDRLGTDATRGPKRRQPSIDHVPARLRRAVLDRQPPLRAFIFFGATQGMDPKMRAQVSRWVAIYAFCIVSVSLYVGAYVLSFFGISIPVLRVAGGIIVAMSGWRMLTEPDATEQRRSEAPAYPRSFDVPPSRLAFYPLTMPLTTGPGTISVAISIGAAGRRRCTRR